jgi:two-component system sensor histidine kinase SenX3
MLVVALALLGVLALLATLQYKWLGRISDAERDRTRATLNTRASGFAQDFDGELTRAYLLFQVDPQAAENLASRVTVRYDRWQVTARYPRMIKEVYVIASDVDAALQRFNPNSHGLEPVTWPAAMEPIRGQLSVRYDRTPTGTFFVRTMPSPLWDSVPALLIPTPMIFFSQQPGRADMRMSPGMSYTVLLIDRDYITNEMLPALAQQHFRQTGDGFDYQLAVVSIADRAPVYHSTAGFSPKPEAKVDAAVDLFQVRMQDFGSIASEIRRFTSTITTTTPPPAGRSTTVREHIVLPPAAKGTLTMRESGPLSIIVQQNGPGDSMAASAAAAAATRMTGPGTPRWRLLVIHPSGSLEGAVNAARRRNLIVSSSILAVLGASMGLLVFSTRRAQELARQQMEFVAAVSHELRTPLAVIRSAGENLADGVVRDEEQIRKYGDLVRNEGRRLTEMVEQILEFAGIESGQRGFALRPVAVSAMLHEIVDSSRSLIDAARTKVEYDIADRLPPVLGDEAALRRVFQNLVANAIKYGGAGGWIGIRARQSGRDVVVTIADRGIGIAPADQARIFEPFYRAPEVIAAQIQGAGLGLSLVKRIVEAHSGRITVQSTQGSGSEFTVVLPAASEEPVGRAALSEAHGSRA